MNCSEQAILNYMFDLLPSWPKYIIYEWIWKNFKNDPAGLQFYIKNNPHILDIKWSKIEKFITIGDFDEWTISKLSSPTFSKKLFNETDKAISDLVNLKPVSEPILVLNINNKYKMLDGWNRTANNFKMFPDGYYCELFVGSI